MSELASWLKALRSEARLSIPQLSEKTKISVRHLEALESGAYSSLPTPVHRRAFALAFAAALDADEDEALERVKAEFDATAPVATLAEAARPAPAGLRKIPALPKVDLQALAMLPWKAWTLLAAGAIVLVLLLNAAVSLLRKPAFPELPPAPAAAASPAAGPAGDGPAQAAVEGPGEELGLRARRPSWVVLEIDGKRLPTVVLERDKRENFRVHKRAVMLAGNIGAVRVWWRGDNLGYFGELGQRMNGVVFEPGQPWRRDATLDLPLPPGVPPAGSVK